MRSCKGYIIGAGPAARGNQNGRASGILFLYTTSMRTRSNKDEFPVSGRYNSGQNRAMYRVPIMIIVHQIETRSGVSRIVYIDSSSTYINPHTSSFDRLKLLRHRYGWWHNPPLFFRYQNIAQLMSQLYFIA